mgnify:FL=1
MRPLSPSDLREFIRSQIVPSELSERYPQVAIAIEGLFKEDGLSGFAITNIRHQVTAFLVGKSSTQSMTESEVNVLLRWTRDREMARKEAWRIVEEIAVENGQRTLWEDECIND